MLAVACKREHFGAETHKLDAVPVVPPDHPGDVAGVGEADALDVLLPETDVGLLSLDRAVLDRMLWLGRVLQRVSVVDDGRQTASARTEDGRLRGAKIRV